MTCNINRSLLDGLVDDQLSAGERLEITSHLAHCELCQQQLVQLRQAKAQLSALKPPPMSSDFDLKLKQKITAVQMAQTQPLTTDNIVAIGKTKAPIQPANKFSTSSMWAMAASVMFMVGGLSWFMLQNPVNDEFLALESEQNVIEITTMAFSESDIKLASLQTSPEEEIQQGFWTDSHATSFDQVTQVDNGYQTFSCGSTSGERGCTLGVNIVMTSLTVTSI